MGLATILKQVKQQERECRVLILFVPLPLPYMH
jgi:hypothetical protein